VHDQLVDFGQRIGVRVCRLLVKPQVQLDHEFLLRHRLGASAVVSG
jgi:hypothetical protein